MRKALLWTLTLGSLAVAASAGNLNQTTNDANWDLVRFQGNPSDAGFKLTRGLTFIAGRAASGDTAAELAVALQAVTNYTNPYANGKTYTGTFVGSEVVALDQNTEGTADRACTILQTLTKISSPTSASGLALLPYRTLQENEILRIFSLSTGEGDLFGVVWENINPNDATRLALFAIADSDLVTQFASAWTYYKRDWKVNADDNTAQFSVLFRKAVWSNSQSTSPNLKLAVTNIYQWQNYDPKTAAAGLTVRKTDGGDNVPVASAREIADNMTTESGYAIDGLSLDDNMDGSATIRRQQTKQNSTTEWYYVGFQAAQGTRPESETVRWANLTSSAAAALRTNAINNAADMTAAYPPSRVGHVLLNVEASRQENGLYGVERTTWIPTWTYTLGDWQGYTNSYAFTVAKFRTKDGADQVRYFAYRVYIIQTTSSSAAFDFIDSEDKHPVKAKVTAIRGGYRGISIVADCTAWAADPGVDLDLGDN